MNGIRPISTIEFFGQNLFAATILKLLKAVNPTSGSVLVLSLLVGAIHFIRE